MSQSAPMVIFRQLLLVPENSCHLVYLARQVSLLATVISRQLLPTLPSSLVSFCQSCRLHWCGYLFLAGRYKMVSTVCRPRAAMFPLRHDAIIITQSLSVAFGDDPRIYLYEPALLCYGGIMASYAEPRGAAGFAAEIIWINDASWKIHNCLTCSICQASAWMFPLMT